MKLQLQTSHAIKDIIVTAKKDLIELAGAHAATQVAQPTDFKSMAKIKVLS